MKKQVIFIHGGDSFNSYEDFLTELQTFTVDPYKEKKKWRMTLKETLGSAYEVFLPEMPNKMNAQYAEWKVWMDKHVPFLKDDLICVGHSLGGVFLTKYLSETPIPFSVRALYLVSAPFFTVDSHDGGSFRLDAEKLGALPTKVQEIVIFHAKDDPIVPFSHAEAYKTAFLKARMNTFEEGGHFIQESFPELVADIKALA